MNILIKNGLVLDPATGFEQIADVRIQGSEIAGIIPKTKPIKKEPAAGSPAKREPEQTFVPDQVIDAEGCYVMPGFIDLHVHLRDPGQTHKETIATGGRAAAQGGFTTICAMPNTKPVIDNAERVAFVRRKAAEESPVRVLQIGAVTVGQEGRELADIAGMAAQGSPAISEDGKSVRNVRLYVEGMREAVKANIPVFAHCEDADLAGDGVMNAGKAAERLGLPGISGTAEDLVTCRDILLAKETGVRLHLCHVSTQTSVGFIRYSKSRGGSITAEACPHHFTLCDDDIPGDNPLYKMNPPLRAKEDREALIEGLRDGTIDVIATDHAPHTMQEKGLSFKGAPFGIVGLETAAALTYTELVQKGVLTPMQMAEKMSTNPAKILGVDRGTIQTGKTADLVIFDPQAEYEIDPSKFAGKGHNTPFAGRKVSGLVKYTIVDGAVVYDCQARHME